MSAFTLSGWMRAFRLLPRIWNWQHHDSRIILEQQGYLKYLVITARAQRAVVRTTMVTVVGVLAVMAGMVAVSAWLHAEKLMLEHSHQEILSALQAVGDDSDSPQPVATRERMLNLAHAIRDRDMQIRQYVGDWTKTLAARNSYLRGLIDSSGLNGKVVSIIQSAAPVGGFNEAYQDNALLSGDFAKETAANKLLRNVLLALPDKMPLQDFETTSEFGIRQHPITNKPSLHAGVDLRPRNGDDIVKAVKAGTVISAGFHADLGNAVTVRHERGIETLYGHMAKIFVKEGDIVDVGTPIGVVGNTGHSTGKHLHFEVLVGSYQVDPKKVIQTAQYVRQIQN